MKHPFSLNASRCYKASFAAHIFRPAQAVPIDENNAAQQTAGINSVCRGSSGNKGTNDPSICLPILCRLSSRVTEPENRFLQEDYGS